jgi:hypothetical protein
MLRIVGDSCDRAPERMLVVLVAVRVFGCLVFLAIANTTGDAQRNPQHRRAAFTKKAFLKI